MTQQQPVEEIFDSGIERYKAGEAPETLIPVFKDICDRSPKNSSAWTCLAWLYLLEGKSAQAVKAAQKGVKHNPQDPQARINLVVAMLETAQKGVRPHVEIAQQLILAAKEFRDEVKDNIADGFQRKPDWPALKRVNDWIFE